ncbi:MAG: hypothetical protein GXY81_06920 [Candidatus Cloacimonetes bacterium]|nr:hypothetical protein [Candidatus Cloacimonadota bacterium]
MRGKYLILGLFLILSLAGCSLFTKPDDQDDPPETYTGGEISSLTMEIAGPTKVKLTWTDTFEDEDGFYIDRREWDGAWVEKMITVGVEVNTAIDNEAELGKVYYYRVRAFKGSAISQEEAHQLNFYLPAPQNIDYDFSWSNPRRICLFWDNVATWADSIVIAKKHSGEDWVPRYAVLPGSAIQYNDMDFYTNKTTTWSFTAHYGEQRSISPTLTIQAP